MCDLALGQELTNRALFPEGTDPDGPDRLTRIEQQVRKLEANNKTLQKRYNSLSRKYDKLLQQGSDPIFGKQAGRSEGMGIMSGLDLLRPAAFLQGERPAREQTGEGGAGEKIGGDGRTFESEEEEEAEAEEETPPPQPAAEGRRRQTGTSGGAGEVIEPRFRRP